MTLEDGALGLVNFFGYDKGISVNVASYYNIGTWIDKIYNRLAANEPLIYLFISNDTNYSGTPISAMDMTARAFFISMQTRAAAKTDITV